MAKKTSIETKQERLNQLYLLRAVEKTKKNDNEIKSLESEIDYFNFGLRSQ